jgi:protein SCO1
MKLTTTNQAVQRVDFRKSVAMFFCVAVASFACGELACGSDDKLPERLDGVSIEEKLGEDIPLDVAFLDDRGTTVSFRELLKDGLPVVLTLNYSNCPGLCVAQLNGLSKGINEVGSLGMGKDFKMVSLSINPREGIDRATATKKRYSDSLASHHRVEGWSFWVGNEPNIQQITKAVGFNYTYDAKNDRYNHAAAAIMISPKGRITRYLYEVGFTPETLKMALVEAGEGRIGSVLDAFVLRCYHYDSNENRYSANAQTILSVAAGLFLVVGLAASLPFWISWRRRSETIRHATEPTLPTTIHSSISQLN